MGGVWAWGRWWKRGFLRGTGGIMGSNGVWVQGVWDAAYC